MNVEIIIVVTLLLLIPLFGLVGVLLRNKLGVNNYNDRILPILQSMISVIFGMRGGILKAAFDPRQWKTDRKSLVLLFIGLPVSIIVIMLTLWLITEIFNF